MSGIPHWFVQLEWAGPHHVEFINNGHRDLIPSSSGCYVFTSELGSLVPSRVLYVGQAVNLRQRLPAYLVDYTRPKVNEGHTGKGFLLEYRQRHGDRALWVRWVEYGGELDTLEASLIGLLNPALNARDEDALHPLFGDDERLDARLLR